MPDLFSGKDQGVSRQRWTFEISLGLTTWGWIKHAKNWRHHWRSGKKNCISHASVGNFLLEDLYMVNPPKMAEIKSQLVVHELTVKLLEPVDYKTIAKEANAWGEFIERLAGPTWDFVLSTFDTLCNLFYFIFIFLVQDTRGQILEVEKSGKSKRLG